MLQKRSLFQVIPLIGLFVGAAIGALLAKGRGGGFLDLVQYALGYGILFFLITLFISICIVRVLS